MSTMKVNLEIGQSYMGSKDYGQVQKDCTEVVRKLITGEIKIPSSEEAVHSTITFRIDDEELDEIKEISKKYNISVQKLLRIGMEQSNLITPQI